MEVTLEQIAPENAGNCISEALKLKFFRGSTPPDPPRAYRLRRAFIRTPLPQILDPPQTNHTQDTSHHLGLNGLCVHTSSAFISASTSSDQICLASSEYFRKYRW